MARERSPARDKAKEMYLNAKGNIKLKNIAEELGVLDTQIRKWKSTDKWEQEIKGTLPKNKRNVTNRKVTEKETILSEVKEIINNNELTDKQKLFCIYYVKYFNATKAAIKAGYSKESAYNIGYENMNKREIQLEIQRLKADKLKGAYLSKEDLLQKYIDIAFADITDFVEFGQEEVIKINEETGEEKKYIINHVNFKNDYEVDGTIISEVKQGRDGVSIKLQDKMKALEFLAKNIGLLDIETKQKLEFEKEKIELLKKDGNSNDGSLDKLIDAISRSK